MVRRIDLKSLLIGGLLVDEPTEPAEPNWP